MMIATTTRPPYRHTAAKAALLATSLAFTSAAAQATAPRLLDFEPTRPSSASELRPLNDAATATLRVLREDTRLTAVHVGRAAPRAAIATRSFELELPDQGRTLRVRDLEYTTAHGFEHLYHFDPATGAETSLVIDGPNMLGWTRTGHETWQFIPLGNGQTAFARYHPEDTHHRHAGDEDWLRELHEQGEVDPDDGGGGLMNARRTVNATAEDETTIDILVVYTPAATTRVGSEVGSMRMLISQSFVNSNRIFKNSGIAIRLRVAHAVEVQHTESSKGIGGDFCLLTVNAKHTVSCNDPEHDDAALDEVQELREEHHADLVTMIVDHEDGPNGLGVGMGGAYSIVAVDAQAGGTHTMTHEIGHNLGGSHNPGATWGRRFHRPYGHGRCNTKEAWSTLMSTNSSGPPDYVPCRTRLPLLSGPNIAGPHGTPTGDRHTHDVARLFSETGPIVAKYRIHKSKGTKTHLVPFVPKPDAGDGIHAFVRILNYSELEGRVAITATDDNGSEQETWLELEPGTTRHFNSRDLEQGNVKGLGPGIGRAQRPRRLDLKSDLDLSVLAYARTADGFVTSLHQTAPKWETANGTRALVEFFNPGSNRTIASVLRIINLEDRDLVVTVHGYDDARTARDVIELSLDRDHATLTLGPKEARNLTSWELEDEPEGARGGIGDGKGKWTIVVSADGDMEVMSLLYNDAGYITNVSR